MQTMESAGRFAEVVQPPAPDLSRLLESLDEEQRAFLAGQMARIDEMLALLREARRTTEEVRLLLDAEDSRTRHMLQLMGDALDRMGVPATRSGRSWPLA